MAALAETVGVAAVVAEAEDPASISKRSVTTSTHVYLVEKIPVVALGALAAAAEVVIVAAAVVAEAAFEVAFAVEVPFAEGVEAGEVVAQLLVPVAVAEVAA